MEPIFVNLLQSNPELEGCLAPTHDWKTRFEMFADLVVAVDPCSKIEASALRSQRLHPLSDKKQSDYTFGTSGFQNS